MEQVGKVDVGVDSTPQKIRGKKYKVKLRKLITKNLSGSVRNYKV